ELKKRMPIRLHIAVSPEMKKLNNSQASKCLRWTHHVSTVEDLVNMANRGNPNRPHHRRFNCACNLCKSDRNSECSKPFLCQEEAVKILDCIHPEWDPRPQLN
ncbi:hypothetical protein B0H13DRAFT_1647298, partial [Mycena leptocephala]